MTLALVLFGVVLAFAAAPHAAWLPASLRAQAPNLMTAALILLPQVPSLLTRDLPPPLGLPLPPRARDLGIGLVASAVLLALTQAASTMGLVQLPPSGLHLDPWAALSFAPLHLVTVVLPEEIFFREYLQDAFDDGGGPQVVGVRFHRGLLVQAGLFGALHVVSFGGTWAALDRALPALAFGALRERTGNLWAPAVLHLACNLWLYLR